MGLPEMQFSGCTFKKILVLYFQDDSGEHQNSMACLCFFIKLSSVLFLVRLKDNSRVEFSCS